MIIKQYQKLSASPQQVFGALTRSAVFSDLTQAQASIDGREGGAFCCFDNQITGRFIELIPNERIVEAWRVAAWEQGVYSLVTFSLSEQDGQTEIALEQTGFPEAFKPHLEAGWSKMYWQPLKAFFN